MFVAKHADSGDLEMDADVEAAARAAARAVQKRDLRAPDARDRR